MKLQRHPLQSVPAAAFLWVAILGLMLVAGCDQTSSSGANEQRADVVPVVRGNLRVEVTESATITAFKETRVQSRMEGKATVIWLIPEGTRVKKGDKLVELDASNQIERRSSQEISVEKARAGAVNADKNLEILRKQNDADREAGENQVTFAMMDLAKFTGFNKDGSPVLDEKGKPVKGEKTMSIVEQVEQIELSKAELKLAEDRYKSSIRLRKEDFITENELERDELDYESKKNRLMLAENRLIILKQYTHKRTELELNQKMKDAQLNLERTIAKCEAKLAQSVADLKSKRAEMALASERLQNLISQIDNAIVTAPNPGIAVYASEGDWRRKRYIEIGASVRERQNLILLPDTSKMLAELRVHEAMADKVASGQPALIEVDNNSQSLTGRVVRRSPLPDSGSRMANPDLKVYKTTVEIDGSNDDGRLRPGMSATVKILIDEIEDVLYVPLQAVRRDGAVRYVWLKTKEGPVARQIEVGAGNDTHIVILKGVKEGDLVYLARPGGAEKPAFEQPKEAERQFPKGEDLTAAPAGKKPDATQDTKKPSPKAADANAKAAGNGKGGGRPGGTGNRGTRGARSPAYTEFQKVLETNLPELAAQLKENRRLFMDPAFKEQLEADPEVKAAYDKMMAGFRSRGSRGEGGRSREGGGGEGRRRGGGGGGEGQRRGGDGGDR